MNAKSLVEGVTNYIRNGGDKSSLYLDCTGLANIKKLRKFIKLHKDKKYSITTSKTSSYDSYDRACIDVTIYYTSVDVLTLLISFVFLHTLQLTDYSATMLSLYYVDKVLINTAVTDEGLYYLVKYHNRVKCIDITIFSSYKYLINKIYSTPLGLENKEVLNKIMRLDVTRPYIAEIVITHLRSLARCYRKIFKYNQIPTDSTNYIIDIIRHYLNLMLGQSVNINSLLGIDKYDDKYLKVLRNLIVTARIAKHIEDPNFNIEIAESIINVTNSFCTVEI